MVASIPPDLPSYSPVVFGIPMNLGMVVALALLLSLLIGLVWSLSWPLGAGLAALGFHVALSQLWLQTFKWIAAALLVSAVVTAAGYLFGPVAAGSTSFVLLAPLAMALLRRDDPSFSLCDMPDEHQADKAREELST